MKEKLFKKISIFDKEFIFFPNTLLLFKDNNGLSSLIDKYDGTNDDEVIKSYGKDKEDEISSALKNIGLVYSAEKKAKSFIEQKKLIHGNLKGIQINTINACNLNCKYCFAEDGTHGRHNKMLKEESDKIVDFLFENSQGNKEVAITVIGGEPFLNIEVFKHILEYATNCSKKYEKKVVFFTTTNGTIYDKELMDLIVKYKVNVSLSLDSNDKHIHDFLRPTKTNNSSYDLIKKNTWNFYTSYKTCVHITVTPKNMNIYEAVKNYYEEGFYCVHVELVKSKKYIFNEKQIDNILKEFDKIAHYLLKLIKENRDFDFSPLMTEMKNLYNRYPKERSCESPYGLIAFSPDSNIYPCDMLMWDEYKIGTIEEGIDEDIRQRLHTKIQQLSQCDACWARYLCGGECIGEIENQNEEERRLLCKFKKHIHSLQLYMFYEIMKENPRYLEKYKDSKE